MAVLSLDNTITLALTVSDRHKSAKWYSDTLGFELSYHIDEAGWSEMKTKTDGVVLGLAQGESENAGNAVPVFGVPDINAAHAALKQAGVTLVGDIETVEGMVSLLTLNDPDGNAIMLAQDLAQS